MDVALDLSSRMSTSDDGARKTGVTCTDCGDVYVARVFPDGDIRPLGIVDCPCGGDKWSPIVNTE